MIIPGTNLSTFYNTSQKSSRPLSNGKLWLKTSLERKFKHLDQIVVENSPQLSFSNTWTLAESSMNLQHHILLNRMEWLNTRTGQLLRAHGQCYQAVSCPSSSGLKLQLHLFICQIVAQMQLQRLPLTNCGMARHQMLATFEFLDALCTSMYPRRNARNWILELLKGSF